MPVIFHTDIPKQQVFEQPDPDQYIARVHFYLKKYLSHREAQAIYLLGQKIHDMEERIIFYTQAVAEIEKRVLGEDIGNSLHDLMTYKYKPVGIEEFICGEYFLNKEQEIYPEVLKHAIELNTGNYTEAVMTGGIGSAKTTLALYTNAYQLYLLSCMRSPQLVFGLDPASEILLIFQSITKQLAQGVDYKRFRSMIEGSKYFREHFPFDKKMESKLVFPNRIEVVPVSGSETAAIGQNVIGGLIDELNYMAVVEKSKVSVDKGTFDQAVAVYNSIARRRKSRFMESGKLPGILCLVSSKKYPGQFTDLKMEEAKTDSSIYVYDKRVWDIKPKAFANKAWFNVFIGDLTRKPRILEPDEVVNDEDRMMIMAIPEDFAKDFKRDIINALREIAGVSTLARHPFFLEVDKVNACFKDDRLSVFSQSPVDFVEQRVSLIKQHFYKPELPRFAHVDLAISGDSAGIAIGCVDDFIKISEDNEDPAFMPHFHLDGVLEVRPPRNSEILFGKIRDVLVMLRKMGLNIRWVTFDQFQSTDSQQILRQMAFITGKQSMDEVPCRAYDFLKGAFYEGRIDLPKHLHLQKEILMLEKDTKTGKVDHPPDGSKDCADALAGVVYGLTMRREIWGMFGIPLVCIPSLVLESKDKLKDEKSLPGYQEVTAAAS